MEQHSEAFSVDVSVCSFLKADNVGGIVCIMLRSKHSAFNRVVVGSTPISGVIFLFFAPHFFTPPLKTHQEIHR